MLAAPGSTVMAQMQAAEWVVKVEVVVTPVRRVMEEQQASSSAGSESDRWHICELQSGW